MGRITLICRNCPPCLALTTGQFVTLKGGIQPPPPVSHENVFSYAPVQIGVQAEVKIPYLGPGIPGGGGWMRNIG